MPARHGTQISIKKLTNKIQIAQNKCIRFCLFLGNRSHVGINEFRNINWLPRRERFERCVCVGSYKFCKSTSPAYMSDLFERSDITHNTRTSTLLLNQPSRKKKLGQQSLSYLGPKFWNPLPSKIKLSANANSFKHGIKEEYFIQLKKEENYPFCYPLHYRGKFSNLL